MNTFTTEPEFADMFRATSPRVFAYVRRHTDADTAPDLVSDVYVVAWAKREHLPDDPLPWLLATARNTLHGHWRSRSRQERLSAELTGIEAVAGMSDADPEERMALLAAFGKLSPDDRETLLLVGWDGMTPTQAAQIVGCSANTFAARLSRARRRLTAHLSGDPGPVRLAAVPLGDRS